MSSKPTPFDPSPTNVLSPNGPSSRDHILSRIRTANGGTSDAASAAADWATIPRAYRRNPVSESHEETLKRFEDRLRDYDAHIVRSHPAHITAAIEARLAGRNHPRMLVPPGFPQAWLPTSGAFTEDRGWSSAELDHFEGVLTSATLAIAETGTLVLQNVPGQGRRSATLVPDFHLCILREEDVVPDVPAALSRLAGTSSLPTTFVSGPSATADIEMTRIKGVHGPRFLDVILLSR